MTSLNPLPHCIARKENEFNRKRGHDATNVHKKQSSWFGSGTDDLDESVPGDEKEYDAKPDIDRNKRDAGAEPAKSAVEKFKKNVRQVMVDCVPAVINAQDEIVALIEAQT